MDNAIRAPLGVHRGAGKRYGFYHADYDLESQFRYLAGLERVSQAKLRELTSGMRIPKQFAPLERKAWLLRLNASSGREFRILDYIEGFSEVFLKMVREFCKILLPRYLKIFLPWTSRPKLIFRDSTHNKLAFASSDYGLQN